MVVKSYLVLLFFFLFNKFHSQMEKGPGKSHLFLDIGSEFTRSRI